MNSVKSTKGEKIVLPDSEVIHEMVITALNEDAVSEDLSAQLLSANLTATATIESREDLILCGSPWANCVFETVDSQITVDWYYDEGQAVAANKILCRVEGSARSLVSAERCALNFLQLLCGIATTAKTYAEQVKDFPVRLRDTRKTLPGLRAAQKYAVLCGGCDNHRASLKEALLIKDNHIAAFGSVTEALQTAQKLFPHHKIQLEVKTLQQLQEALAAGAASILLDNFSPEQLRQAVMYNNKQAILEASGGITLQNLKAIASTGVDYISIGALTKHCKSLDISMNFTP